MKNLIFIAILSVFAFFSCKNDDPAAAAERSKGPVAQMIDNPSTADLPTDTNQLARIRFETREHNFGTVKEGSMVEYAFKFVNTGKVPLTILTCRSSCGCTVPDWPTEPIPQGGTGEITAKFNTEDRIGEQKKTVFITANTYPNESQVTLKGTVVEK